MKSLRLVVAALWALPWAAPAFALERDVRHQFAVQPGCMLKIDTYRGNVHVTEGDAPEVRVAIHLEVGGETDEAAARVLAGLQLEVKEHENTVSIVARNPRETRVRWSWRENEQIELTYRITVPRQCHVDLKATQAAVIVGRLEGRMRAQVESGSIFFRGVTGSLDASITRGDIIVSRCSGALTARTLEGLIRVGPVGGRADCRTTNGDIEIMSALAEVKAAAEVGDIVVGFPRELGGDANLTAGTGAVVVKLDPAANVLIDASSTWERVECALPVTIDAGGSGQKRLRGRLNQGGPRLVLRSSGGRVKIERGETVD